MGRRLKDYTGVRSGKLIATKYTGKKSKDRAAIWEAKCDCGNTIEIEGKELGRSKIKSCGCGKAKDITDKKIGRLTAIRNTRVKCPNGDFIWEFQCDCGNIIETTIGNFNSGHSRSCGCLAKESAKNRPDYHGMKDTSEYKTWCLIKERCHNPNCKSYPTYGGAGLTVCEEWRKDFKVFIKDIGTKPHPDCTIDRIDNNKGYSKDNCRWADPFQQARNKLSRGRGVSKYKGVHFEESSGKWITAYTVGKYKNRKIKRHLCEDTAAAYYNLAATLIWGEEDKFLKLNETPVDYRNLKQKGKFFDYWVDIMKKEARRLTKLYEGDL